MRRGAQLTIYVNDETYNEIKELARAEGTPISKVALEMIMMALPKRKELSPSRMLEVL